MGHTPGPWKVNSEKTWMVIMSEEATGGMGFKCAAVGEAKQDELEANAHLIAASPEMHEACEAAIRYDDAIRSCANNPYKMASYCTAEGEGLDTLYCDWMVKSFKAIKKARGE